LTLAPRIEEKKVQPVDSFGSQSGSVPHAAPPPLKASAPAVSEIPVFPARLRPAPGGTAHPESQGARPSEAVFSGSIFAKAKSKKEKAKAGSRSAYAGLVAAGVLLVAGGVGWHWWAHSGRLAAARRAAFVPTNNTLAAPAAEQNVVTVTANAASGKVTATLPPAVRPGELVAGAVKSEKAEKAGKKSTLAELKLSAPVAARRGAGAGSSAAPDMAPEMAGSIPSGALGELTPAQSGQPGAPIQGGQVVRPKQISIIPPQYTPLAQRQHIQGDVTLDILVDVGGRVASVKVVSGPPLLRQAAIEAVRQWKYQPGLLDGAPSPMHVTETVRFRLE
jgi:TonB family protein